MGRARWALLAMLALVCVVTVVLTLRDWAAPGLAEVRGVPSGHQEIAWISPATNGDAWERLVAALTLLQEDKGSGALGKNLRVQLDNAFLPLTADVPEVALFFDDAPEVKLWIRWYKLSGGNPSGSWFDKLMKRGTSPLAIIGGETSDRALYQARALEKVRGQWPGPAPLYFISTATADRYVPGEYRSGDVPYQDWPRLMDVYKKRTYRFCFPNTRIVEAVLDFVHQNPQVCAQRLTSPQVAAAVIAPADPYTSLGLLSAAGHFQPYYPSTLIWKDDGYSKDLGEIFLKVFADEAHPKGEPFADFYNNYIQYSVGDFFEPNPQEALAVGLFLAHNPRFRDQPQLLALPTAAQRARRFLRTVCRRAPTEVRNVVVVTGDAIAFNNVYRDRDLAWNILDMPVPLVFFSHRNPIDAAAGFGQHEADGLVNETGTQDVLLNRDIVEAVVQAAFDGGGLVPDADKLQGRLEHTRWRKGRVHNDLVQVDNLPAVPFFDAAGNRRADTGEHIVWLRPVFDGQRNLPEAFITVWRAGGERPERSWRTFASALHVLYDQPTREESDVHGGD